MGGGEEEAETVCECGVEEVGVDVRVRLVRGGGRGVVQEGIDVRGDLPRLRAELGVIPWREGEGGVWRDGDCPARLARGIGDHHRGGEVGERVVPH